MQSEMAQNAKSPSKPIPEALATMGPPPNPQSQPIILEPEFNALSTCLKNATVNAAQIYEFHADAHRLGLANYVSRPPQNLMASLGREIEKYDELCDVIESHLLQAIAVLQRDLRREQRRIDEEREAAEKKQAEAVTPTPSPTTAKIGLPTTYVDGLGQVTPTPTHSPPATSSLHLGRRQSTISFPSLQRPTLPTKLDLSSASLRMTGEEATMFSSALASPVTLAPKSARPVGANDFPPDLMAAFASSSAVLGQPVEIDLTVPEHDHHNELKLDPTLGNSADKPIELDIDTMDIDMAMTDLFGDSTDSSSSGANQTMDGLFSPVDDTDTPLASDALITKNDGDAKHFMGNIHQSQGSDIFASLESTTTPETKPALSSQSAPSPGTLLASFSSPSQLQNAEAGTSNMANVPSGDTHFDLNSLDLTNLSPGFFSNAPDSEVGFSMDMDDLLNLGSVSEEKGEGVDATTDNPT